MDIVIVSDVFGLTEALEALGGQLSAQAVIIDPYSGEYNAFRNEDEAYGYFQKKVGIRRYKETVFKAVANAGPNLFLIGFSAGAASIWAISDQLAGWRNTQAVCFYGSQIRNFVHINPQIHMELIFPAHEPHIDVDGLIHRISPKENVTCRKADALHGFMNRRSIHFNPAVSEEYIGYLKKKIRSSRSVS